MPNPVPAELPMSDAHIRPANALKMRRTFGIVQRSPMHSSKADCPERLVFLLPMICPLGKRSFREVPERLKADPTRISPTTRCMNCYAQRSCHIFVADTAGYAGLAD